MVVDRNNTASDEWADTPYRSVTNLALLERRGLKPQFQRKEAERTITAHLWAPPV